MALYQLGTVVQAYFRYETTIVIEELERENHVFPDVTVCKMNPAELGLFTHSGDQSPSLSLQTYLDEMRHMIESASQSEKKILEELYGLAGYYHTITDNYLQNGRTSRFTVDCHFRKGDGETMPCSELNYSVRFLTPSYPSCILFKTHDFESRKALQSMSAIFYLDDFHPNSVPTFGLDSSFPQSSGVGIFIHPPNTFPDLLSGVAGSPGWDTSIQVREKRRQLARHPYSNCNAENYDNILDDSDFSYTERACRDNCSQSRSISECACLDARFPTSASQRRLYRFCGHLSSKDAMVKNMNCAMNRSVAVDDKCDALCIEKCLTLRYKYQSDSAIWPHETQQLAFYNKYINNARYPANFNIYDDIEAKMATNKNMAYEMLRATSLIRRNFLKVKIFFGRDNVMLIRDMPIYTAASMSGSLGGILNLWIGISFVTVVEVVELFYHLIKVLLERDRTPTTSGDTDGQKQRSTVV